MLNQPKPANKDYIPSLSKNTEKFLRRTDLTPFIRLYIAFTALMSKTAGIWGTITALSKQFMISRTFVYMLAETLEKTSPIIFGNTSSPTVIEKRLPYSYILSLRLEGRCSIEVISTIMKRFDINLASTGAISQYLTYFGSLLPDTLKANGEIQLVVFLSDEIFSKSIPLLVTVEPISSAILRIELADTRKAEDWKRHWECLEKNGYFAIYLVSDEGKGLCSAQKEALSETFRQPDTYHAIAHQLGQWVKILKNVAYKAIEEEYERYKKLDSAKSDRVIDKRIDEYEKAKKNADEKIELYENFKFIYISLIEELNVFDSNGKIRDRKEAEANIKTGLDMIEILGNTKFTNAVNKMRRLLPELLNYFDVAQGIVTTFENIPVDHEAIQALCLAWQWKKAMIKAKNADRKRYCVANENFCLEIATGYLQENDDVVKEHIYGQLDNIVQSSALVECINSIIRPYLNSSKNHITQETLNLIMFYHNHRRYNSGKRVGKTPMEILTGKPQKKDWIEILFDVVEESNPSFFASSE